jgi:hypothetical protein
MASVPTLLLTDDVTACCSPLTGGSLDPAAADEAVDVIYHETDLREELGFARIDPRNTGNCSSR